MNSYAKNREAIEQVIDPVAIEQEIEQYRIITELIDTCADCQSYATQYVGTRGLIVGHHRKTAINEIFGAKHRYVFANFAKIWKGEDEDLFPIQKEF